jgi:Tfp pilus assembly protein PilF
MRFVVCLLVFVVLPISADAQGRRRAKSTQNARESLRLAQVYVSRGCLDRARQQLEQTIRIKKSHSVLNCVEYVRC